MTPSVVKYILLFGVWLSLVERFVRDEEAVGSNPVTPINKRSKITRPLKSGDFLFGKTSLFCL